MSTFSCRGFSLFELIAVIVITSVLAITVIPRFSISDNNLQDAKDTVLTALRHSRELALARAQTNTSIRFISSATTIDIREEGNSVYFPGAVYPLNLPPNIRIQQGSGVIVFDKLGNTSAVTIEVGNGTESEVITLTGSGYAY